MTRAVRPAVATLLFFLGAFPCFPHLYVTFGLMAMVLLATLWTGAYVTVRRAPWRMARWIAAVVSGVLYLAVIYGAVLFTTVLGWSLPVWALALPETSVSPATAGPSSWPPT